MKVKIYALILTVLTALSTTSCLDDEYLVDWDDIKAVIELPYTRHYVNQTVNQGNDATFDLMVNYTIANWRNQNDEISVGLKVDADQVGDYVLLPASTYTLPATLEIHKQTQLTTHKLTVNTSGLEKGKTYALPVVISNVPSGYTISGNFNLVVFRVTVR